MKPTVTIYDVAEKAGVSISTVSKVLNNTGSIAEKTRQKVRDTMRELNYQPSVVASVKKRIQTTGFSYLVLQIRLWQKWQEALKIM